MTSHKGGGIGTDEPGADHVRHVAESENVCEAVVRAVEAVSGRSALELPPIQESVDADALDRLFASSTTVEWLQFEYVGYEVTVEPGRVRVRDRP